MPAKNTGPESPGHQQTIMNRLRRIEGQIRGLQRLADEGVECDKFLTQLAAARAALDGVGLAVVSQDMKKCLAKAADDAAIDKAIKLFMRHAERISG